MTGSFTGSLCRLGREWVCALFESALGFGLSNAQMLEALLEGGDLAEPAFVLGLDKALLGVLSHLVNAAELGRIHAQETTSGAGMFMNFPGILACCG
jgi:hypothetical protein